MVSTRVYRAGKPYEATAAELERHAGRQFDPAIVAAFHRVPRGEWDGLRRSATAAADEDKIVKGWRAAAAGGEPAHASRSALVH